MQSFIALLKAEVLKSKNSFAVWLSVGGTLGNTIIFFLINWFDLGPHKFGAQPDFWHTYILNHYEGVAFMMLPLYVIILATLLTFMEYRSGTWSLVMSLPESRALIYWAKLAFGLLLFLAAHLLFIIGLFFSGVLLGWLHKSYVLPITHFPIGMVLILGAKTLLSIIAIMALHLWISLRFKHFIIPLTIGILGFVFTAILTPAFPYQWLNPYAYPICYMPAFTGEITLSSFGGLNVHEWMSLLWGLCFLLVGTWQVKRISFQ